MIPGESRAVTALMNISPMPALEDHLNDHRTAEQHRQ
jgi:hypothetical protein